MVTHGVLASLHMLLETHMKVIGLRIKLMELESTKVRIAEEHMLDSGSMICKKGLGQKSGKMDQCMKENSAWVKRTESVNKLGPMDQFTQAIGIKT